MTNSHISKHVVIGNNVEIGKYCVIGKDGFGYIEDENGMYKRTIHTAKVIIEDNVSIHNNVCIDRGRAINTIIGADTKIDNLVHVAHGAQIGKHCLLAAGAIVGGSVKIGDNCVLWVNSCIRDHVTIGDNVTVGMGSVVTKDVPSGVTIYGSPAKIKYVVGGEN